MKIRVIIILLFYFNYVSFSQDELSNSSEARMDEIVEEGLTNSEVEDYLQEESEKKNINAISYSELGKLNFLTRFQAQMIHEHRLKYGGFVSLEELYLISGFDESLIQKMKMSMFVAPIQVRDTIDYLASLKYSKQQVSYRWSRPLQLFQGYKYRYFAGSADKMQLRYHFKSEFAGAQFTIDKDAGEAFWNEKYGLDFYSACIYIEGRKKDHRLLLGDFHTSFGQGLVSKSAYAIKKTHSIAGYSNQELSFVPSSGSDENRFFRGMAGSYSMGNLQWNAFISKKKIDISGQFSDSTGNIVSVSSFQRTGYHATWYEVFNRKKMDEFIYGMNVAYRKSRFKWGLTFTSAEYQYEYLPMQRFDNYHAFQGRKIQNIGTDAKLIWTGGMLFTEIAMNSHFRKAFLFGLQQRISSYITFHGLLRNYDAGYFAPYFKAFGDRYDNQNELGLFMSLVYRFSYNNSLNFFYDIFRPHWIQYYKAFPGFANDISLLYTAKYNDFNISFKFRYKEAHNSFYDENYIQSFEKENLKWSSFIQYTPFSYVQFYSRIDMVFVKMKDEMLRGYYAFEEMKYIFASGRYSASFRYGIFLTQGYETAVYSTEGDLLNAFNSVILYDAGCRYYFLFQLKPDKSLRFRFKIGSTIYKDKENIGSGNFKINGNKVTELRCQMIWNF